MKTFENPAKLSKGCKKGLKNVSSSQIIQCWYVFVFKRTYQRTTTNSGVRRCGVHGRVSQLITYSIHTKFQLWIRQVVKGLIDFTRSGNVSRWGLVCMFCLMVLNATFSNISAITWRSVLLEEGSGWPGENNWPVASHWQTLSNNVVLLALIVIRTHNISGNMY